MACAQEDGSIIGRPYKSFDVTAFCSYIDFHPSQYLTDNNWDILCAFTEPGKTSKLDSLGISFNKSQLRLLEVGGLLKSDNGAYSTVMPIFGKDETRAIRKETKAFADSIFPTLESQLKNLVNEFKNAGFSNQTYSLVFSYLLDGYIWDDKRLTPSDKLEDHGTWSGAYWAMYEDRSRVKIGTNGYGAVHINWTDELGYWLSNKKLLSFAREVAESNGSRIDNPEMIENLAGWGLVDADGNITVPVMIRNNNDPIDLLCKSITTALSDAVKRHCIPWKTAHKIGSSEEAEVIFYHEVMWDLLDLCEEKGIISMPPILKGEEVGKQHFGDIAFIVIDYSDTVGQSN